MVSLLEAGITTVSEGTELVLRWLQQVRCPYKNHSHQMHLNLSRIDVELHFVHEESRCA